MKSKKRRKIECGHCDFTAWTPQEMTDHMQVHSGGYVKSESRSPPEQTPESESREQPDSGGLTREKETEIHQDGVSSGRTTPYESANSYSPDTNDNVPDSSSVSSEEIIDIGNGSEMDLAADDPPSSGTANEGQDVKTETPEPQEGLEGVEFGLPSEGFDALEDETDTKEWFFYNLADDNLSALDGKSGEEFLSGDILKVKEEGSSVADHGEQNTSEKDHEQLTQDKEDITLDITLPDDRKLIQEHQCTVTQDADLKVQSGGIEQTDGSVSMHERVMTESTTESVITHNTEHKEKQTSETDLEETVNDSASEGYNQSPRLTEGCVNDPDPETAVTDLPSDVHHIKPEDTGSGVSDTDSERTLTRSPTPERMNIKIQKTQGSVSETCFEENQDCDGLNIKIEHVEGNVSDPDMHTDTHLLDQSGISTGSFATYEHTEEETVVPKQENCETLSSKAGTFEAHEKGLGLKVEPITIEPKDEGSTESKEGYTQVCGACLYKCEDSDIISSHVNLFHTNTKVTVYRVKHSLMPHFEQLARASRALLKKGSSYSSSGKISPLKNSQNNQSAVLRIKGDTSHEQKVFLFVNSAGSNEGNGITNVKSDPRESPANGPVLQKKELKKVSKTQTHEDAVIKDGKSCSASSFQIKQRKFCQAPHTENLMKNKKTLITVRHPNIQPVGDIKSEVTTREGSHCSEDFHVQLSYGGNEEYGLAGKASDANTGSIPLSHVAATNPSILTSLLTKRQMSSEGPEILIAPKFESSVESIPTDPECPVLEKFEPTTSWSASLCMDDAYEPEPLPPIDIYENKVQEAQEASSDHLYNQTQVRKRKNPLGIRPFANEGMAMDPNLYVCTLHNCGRSFTALSGLASHVRLCHPDGKMFYCGFCWYGSTSREDVRSHTLFSHSGERLQNSKTQPPKVSSRISKLGKRTIHDTTASSIMSSVIKKIQKDSKPKVEEKCAPQRTSGVTESIRQPKSGRRKNAGQNMFKYISCLKHARSIYHIDNSYEEQICKGKIVQRKRRPKKIEKEIPDNLPLGTDPGVTSVKQEVPEDDKRTVTRVLKKGFKKMKLKEKSTPVSEEKSDYTSLTIKQEPPDEIPTFEGFDAPVFEGVDTFDDFRFFAPDDDFDETKTSPETFEERDREPVSDGEEVLHTDTTLAPSVTQLISMDEKLRMKVVVQLEDFLSNLLTDEIPSASELLSRSNLAVH